VTVNNAHAATAKLFDDAVVRDGLPDRWRESYVCKTSKSMKALDLISTRQDAAEKSPNH